MKCWLVSPQPVLDQVWLMTANLGLKDFRSLVTVRTTSSAGCGPDGNIFLSFYSSIFQLSWTAKESFQLLSFAGRLEILLKRQLHDWSIKVIAINCLRIPNMPAPFRFFKKREREREVLSFLCRGETEGRCRGASPWGAAQPAVCLLTWLHRRAREHPEAGML